VRLVLPLLIAGSLLWCGLHTAQAQETPRPETLSLEQISGTWVDKERPQDRFVIGPSLSVPIRGGDYRGRDPYDFLGIERRGAQVVNLVVSEPDGPTYQGPYAYTYDQALFDGETIVARRIMNDVRDADNPSLPEKIRQDLIANYAPPAWLVLKAARDPETGIVVLRGEEKSGRVSYDPDYLTINGISFFSEPQRRALYVEGSLRRAEGAAADARP